MFQIATKLLRSFDRWDTNCLISSLKIKSCKSLMPSLLVAIGDSGSAIVGGVGVALKRHWKSSEKGSLVVHCWSAATVFWCWRRSPCSSLQPNIWPCMSAVAPLNFGVE